MLYDLLKKCTSMFFNMLNILLGGKLPPFGSASVVVENHDRYLVVELPGQRIVFPGGFMTWREHPQQAAEREGHEETGLVLRADDLISYYSLSSNRVTNMSTISFVYHGVIVGGEMHPTIEGRPCWLPENELRLRFDEHSRRILDDYLRYRARQREEIERLSTVKTLSLVS